MLELSGRGQSPAAVKHPGDRVVRGRGQPGRARVQARGEVQGETQAMQEGPREEEGPLRQAEVEEGGEALHCALREGREALMRTRLRRLLAGIATALVCACAA